jgi:hypothetical protein
MPIRRDDRQKLADCRPTLTIGPSEAGLDPSLPVANVCFL